LEFPTAKDLLVIAPHEDDDILGPGGTLIKGMAKGKQIHVLYVSRHSDRNRAEAIYQETLKVKEYMGSNIDYMPFTFNNISVDSASIRLFLEKILLVKPKTIFLPFFADDHDDHRRVNELLLKSDLEHELRDCEIWAYQVYSSIYPNVVVDITDEIQIKNKLIRYWQNVEGNRDWAHYMTGINAANCRYIGSKNPIYVECFFVVPIKDYLGHCRKYFAEGNVYHKYESI
jgi:LmbE family N-acetylglucosaminyl deacetylase